MSRCLDINFGYLDNTVAAITASTAALDLRMSDYNGVRNRITNINSNTSNLSTANSYIDKKKRQLADKRDSLRAFNKDVISFGAYAKAQDIKTSAAIHISGHRFYHKEGLAHGAIYAIGAVISDGVKWLSDQAKKAVESIKDTVSSVWKWIKKVYEDNKYWIDVVVDVLAVVASVAAIIASGGAFVALLPALWGTFKAISSLVFDSAALVAFCEGDMETAKKFNGKGAKDALQGAFGKAGEVIYTGMEIASAACGIVNICKDFKKINNMKNLGLHKNLSPGRQMQAKRIINRNTIKTVVGFDRTKKLNLNGTVNGIKEFAKISKNIKFCVGLPRDIVKSGFGGVLKNINITKNIYSIVHAF